MSNSEHEIALLVGGVLREFRRRAGLSQESLAPRAHLHRTYVGAVERGERNPTIKILARWLRGCEVSWTEFGSAVDEAIKTLPRSSIRGSQE